MHTAYIWYIHYFMFIESPLNTTNQPRAFSARLTATWDGDAAVVGVECRWWQIQWLLNQWNFWHTSISQNAHNTLFSSLRPNQSSMYSILLELFVTNVYCMNANMNMNMWVYFEFIDYLRHKEICKQNREIIAKEILSDVTISYSYSRFHSLRLFNVFFSNALWFHIHIRWWSTLLEKSGS